MNPLLFVRKLKRKVYSSVKASVPQNKVVGTLNLETREAWMKSTLASIPAGNRILDAGAGELKYKSLCSHLDYVSQDFAQYEGIGDSRGLQTGSWDQTKLDIISDITKVPEPDASFDVVMCIEVLEHLPSPVEALRELSRLLRPNGLLIVTAPFCSLTHFAPFFFQTGYSRYFYEYWLGEFGFEIEDMQWNGNFFEYLAQEIRRLPAIAEQYAQAKMETHEQMAINTILNLLGKLSERDQGSEQLLSFGIHVRARKRTSATC